MSIAVVHDSSPERATVVSSQAWRSGLLAAASYLCLTAAWFLVASMLWDNGHRAGVVVSDAVSWHRNFAAVTEENPLRMARPGHFFLAFYQWSPHLNSVLNAILVAASIVLTAVAVEVAVGGPRGLRAARIAAFAMALNPWLWVVTLGPTKEPFALPAVAASALFILRPRGWTSGVAMAALMVLAIARVEQSIMLFGIMIVALLMRRTSQPRLVLLAAISASLAVGVVLFWAGEGWLGYERFFNLSPQLWPVKDTQVGGPEGRIGELGRWLSEKGWHDPFWNIFALGYRLAANLFGTILRMGVRTVDGLPSVLGIGQAITGYIVFTGFIVTAWRVRREGDRQAQLLALHLAIIWIGASMVAFVQPRYILVELPIALIALATATASERRAVLICSLVGALVLRIGLTIAGMGIPADRPLADDRPPFLLLRSPEDAPS